MESATWPPFTQIKTAPSRLFIVRGEGALLIDHHGERYLDAISSWWVNLHGHGHPEIARRIFEQAMELEHVIFANCTHRPGEHLAERLLQCLPGEMAKIFYSDNGSTAVETALKMALQYWYNKDPHTSKKRVICFQGGYHGDTFGAMSVAGKQPFNRPFWSHLFEVDLLPPPLDAQRTLEELHKLLSQEQAACFIFEPLVLGVGGMQIYSAKLLDQLIEMCRAHDVITIADEVMTGFGRLGTLFACDQLTASPDIICLSKGITGGFLPLGVTACRQEIFDTFYSTQLKEAFLHGHSYTGNPLACASALASLDLLEKEESQEQRQMIAALHTDFCLRYASHSKFKRCQSIGTILVMEYQSQHGGYFDAIRQALFDFFLDKGILIRPLGNVLYLMPPYCMTREQLTYIYKCIIETLEKDTWIKR